MSSHNKPEDSTAGESSNSIIATKTSKSLTCSVASCVNSALPLAVVMTAEPCDLLMVTVFTRSESILDHHVERCAAVHNELLTFMFTV